MRPRATYLTIAVALVAAIVVPSTAADAQGNGRPKAPRTKSGTSSAATPPAASTGAGTSSATGTPASGSLTSVFSYRQFGTWLDDASAPTRGEGSTSVGVGHWRLKDASQTNLPMLGAAYGITDRLQVNASVPFYRVTYQGATWGGIDDVYIGGKYTLIDPTLTISEFGLAISPVMEVLTAGTPDGRVHFAIPLNLELRRAPLRLYGSAGYFTRGSVFTGAALEWTTPARLVLTGALTQSYSTKADAALDRLAVGRQRVDTTASAAYPLGSIAAVFMSIGRSLSSVDQGGTRLAVTGGISFRFAAAQSTQ